MCAMSSPAAWEQVEHSLMSMEEFRRFTYLNVVEQLTAMNPSFFDDTAIADAIERDGLDARRPI
jgi:hypothetical protein